MNYKEIENLKSTLMNMVKQGCKVRNEVYGVDGNIVGVGFRPYWTNPADSKIDKLEFNVLDRNGRVMPFYLYNIVGYKVIQQNETGNEKFKGMSMDLHVFSPDKATREEPYDKVRIDIY